MTINAVESCMDIPDCMTAAEIRQATLGNEHLGILTEYVLSGWPSTKAGVQNEMQPYWPSMGEIAIIEGISMKGRRIIVPASLQDKALKQLHLINMGIENTRLLVCELIYWVNMNCDMEEMIKNCPTYLDIQSPWTKDKALSHEIPEIWIGGADIFASNNKNYLYFVDCHSKFPTVKQDEGFQWR